MMFILLTDGTFWKWSPNGKADNFVKSSQSEFQTYRDESVGIWWNTINQTWGGFRQWDQSLKDAGKLK